MTEEAQIITLGAEEEADRLWQRAHAARSRAGGDIASLCEALDLGLRAAEIHAGRRLRPIKSAFPITIGLLLEVPRPEVEPFRDAVHIPQTLGFTDVLDLLSAESLACVAPGLHRGWEDRVLSCRRCRATARQELGMSLDAAQRDSLLVLAAYRNRLFRTPPPLEIKPAQILLAFGELERLVEALAG